MATNVFLEPELQNYRSPFGILGDFSSCEEVAVHEPLDVHSRLEDLKVLQDGWLDGDGKALDADGITWCANCFSRFYTVDVPFPLFCPTVEGGVYAEWSFDKIDISLEIDLENRVGHWHSLNVEDQTYTEKDLNLNLPESWTWLCNKLVESVGVH
ncbi:MAG: hypothetical protein ACRC46_04675 [Thermoguttaceae bacterium]